MGNKVSLFEQDIQLPAFDPTKVMTKAAVCEIANIDERDLKHVESTNTVSYTHLTLPTILLV